MHTTRKPGRITRWSLALLLAGAMLGGLAQHALAPRNAQAQIPDSGAQRNDMIRELQAISTGLEEIKALLKSGKVVVTIAEPEKKKPR